MNSFSAKSLCLSIFALFTFLLAGSVLCYSQSADSASGGKNSKTNSGGAAVSGNVVTDSSKTKRQKVHSPKKALLYSAILPGLGQAYNHKYWKIPIIYAAEGVMAYFISFDNGQYNDIQNALVTRSNGGIDLYQNYTTSQLTTIRDQWHYYRDLSVIGAAFFYLLNLIDAEVDAQFYSFNINDDLSARFTPSITSFTTLYGTGTVPSFSFVLKFK